MISGVNNWIENGSHLYFRVAHKKPVWSDTFQNMLEFIVICAQASESMIHEGAKHSTNHDFQD